MKNSIIRQSPKRENKRKQSRKRQPELTIGLDLETRRADIAFWTATARS